MSDDIVLVTGANGFIGRAVVRRLLRGQYSVRAMVRRTSTWPFATHPRLERVIGDMRDPAALERVMTGVQWVVHLAAAKADEPDSEQTNVEGARHLIRACTRAGVRCLINVSTQSAKLRHPGLYGRTKAAADALFHAAPVPTTTLRASLVYGEQGSGAFESVLQLTRLPVMPLIGGGAANFRPIHCDDLARVIELAAERPATRGRIYDVGGPDALTMRQLLGVLCEARGVRRPMLRVPGGLALLIARGCAVLPHPPLTLSNVRGACEDLPMDVEAFVRDFAFVPRRFQDGLNAVVRDYERAGSPASREATLLLRYVLSAVGGRWTPTLTDVDRYHQALRAHGISEAPTLSPLVLGWPWLLGSLDAISRLRYPHSALQRKLLVAAAIAECHPASAPAFLERERHRASVLMHAGRLALRAALKWLGAVPLLACASFTRRNVGAT